MAPHAGGRPPKLTHRKIYYQSFRKKFPRLAKSVIHWEPNYEYNEMCIELWLDSGNIFIYSGIRETAWLSKRRWK